MSTKLETTNIPVWLLAHHCRVASERYSDNAVALVNMEYDQDDKLVMQFRKQADEARALADALSTAVIINGSEIRDELVIEVTSEIEEEELVTAEEFYTERELEILQDRCIYHAVFATVGEFGMEENDFLDWLANRKTPFATAMNRMSACLEAYEEFLEKTVVDRMPI